MIARIFVDTNVLVYSRDAGEPAKQPRAEAWRRALWKTRSGRLSVQVLHEYYVTVTRKLSPGLPKAQARAEVEDLLLWQPVDLSADLLKSAWKAEDRYKLSFWDALIVAAARAAECTHLLSEHLQSASSMDGIRVVHPFEVAPEALLDF